MKIKPITTKSSCKVCGKKAELYTVVDFNKYCDFNAPHANLLPLTGVPIYYHKCSVCGLLFTHSFDDWRKEDFIRHIYNDDYVAVDPEYERIRPQNCASWLRDNVSNLSDCTHLDYGSGSGFLSEMMAGCTRLSESWDPFVTPDLAENKQYSLITAFEVIEHSPEPRKIAGDILDRLCDEGKVIISTVTSPHPFNGEYNRWYIGPRNGHVTVYTDYALDILFSEMNCSIKHISNCYHIVTKNRAGGFKFEVQR